MATPRSGILTAARASTLNMPRGLKMNSNFRSPNMGHRRLVFLWKKSSNWDIGNLGFHHIVDTRSLAEGENGKVDDHLSEIILRTKVLRTHIHPEVLITSWGMKKK